MEGLMEPETLRTRVLRWVRGEIDAGALPKKAGGLVEAILYRGSLPRSELANVLGTADRTARRIAAPLIERGVLQAETHKADLKLGFPMAIATEWLPGLFPNEG